MFVYFKETFIRLVTRLVNASSNTEFVFLSNQPTLINLHPNEYTKRLPYYLFAA